MVDNMTEEIDGTAGGGKSSKLKAIDPGLGCEIEYESNEEYKKLQKELNRPFMPIKKELQKRELKHQIEMAKKVL